MATVGTLIFEMSANIARLQQDMAKAQTTVKTATEGITSAINVAKGAIEALGFSLSAHAFVSFIEGGIEAEASLHRLALQTGITVETLSALRPVAKEAGTDLDTAAGMVNKLEKNMLTFAQSGGGKAADAFKQLGYTQDQVRTGLQNMDTFLPEFARRLIDAGVGGEQAGLAMQLMARGGAAALPFLEQLARQLKLVGTETKDQVAAAHEFEVSMAKLKEGSTLLSISLGNEMLPWLNRITQAMIEARKEGSLLATVLAGNRAFWTGDDRTKNDKALTEQTAELFAKEKDLDTLRKQGYSDESMAVVTIKAKIKALQDEIATTMTYRKVLEEVDEATRKRDEARVAKPLANLGKGAPSWTDEDETRYKLLVQAAKELDGITTQRLKDEQAEADAFDKATAEFLRWTDAQNRALAQQAQHWKDIVDPLEPYRRQMEEINNLYAQNLLTSTQWSGAINSVAHQMDQLGKAADKTNEEAHSFGLTMESAFGKMITAGNKSRDVVKALGQDLAQLIAKITILQPMEKAVEDWYKGAVTSSGGGMFGGLLNAFGLGGVSDVAPGTNVSYSEALISGLTPLATGTDYVPQTGPYLLHQGEAVVPAGENNGSAQPVVVQMTFNSLDPRTHVQLMTTPKMQQTIRGIIEKGFAMNGTVSGMAHN